MTEQWIFIEPQDVWMFRDSKPFDASQNFVARSQFPPNPKTMQGVIRTHWLEAQGVDWHAYNSGNGDQKLYQAVGDAESLGALRIHGPFIARRSGGKLERIYRTPLDILYNKETQQYTQMAPSRRSSFFTEPPFEGWLPVMHNGSSDYKEAGPYISSAQMAAYLDGNVDGRWESVGTLYEEEERIGLALDSGRRAARESHFYRARFIRPGNDVGLLLSLNATLFDPAQPAQIRMGGESRTGRCEVVEYKPLGKPVKGRARIVLQTPAYFSGGWSPANFDWSPWVGKGRLVSMIVGKPQAISGWDIAKNRAKALRNFVPAGSVYYFEDAEVTGKPFTEAAADEPDYGAMGFGSFVAGQWNYLD